MTNVNQEVWEKRYAEGEMLWYPYDIATRLVRSKLPRDGVVLDHGFGSGNHLEFLTRFGLNVVGTEVSQSAISAVERRFTEANLRLPEMTLFDPERPLAGQLPAYDHLFSWLSVYYNRKAKCIQDISDLIGGMATGGHFILAIPSQNDLVIKNSELEADGTFRNASDLSGQKGTLITIPESKEELLSWCADLDVQDCGTYGWTLDGQQVEHFFVHGVKP